MTSYPVVRSEFLDTPRAGIPGWGRRQRSPDELPQRAAHHAVVYRVDGRYVLGSGDADVVGADRVSLVDVRREVPVTVEMSIPSADAGEFHLRVTFACTVTDPVAVVRENVQAAQSILDYLQRDSRLGRLGLDLRMEEVNRLRRDVSARVRAYTEVIPPDVRGLDVRLLAVEVPAPPDLTQVRSEMRAALPRRWLQKYHDLESAMRGLDVDSREARLPEDRRQRVDPGTAGMPPAKPRVLIAQAPSHVTMNSAMSLVVSIRRSQPDEPGSAIAWLSALTVAPGGTTVTVSVHPPPGLHVAGPQQMTMLVLPGGDPDPVRFEVLARETGLHRMGLRAWVGGSFLASLSVEIAVTESGTEGPALRKSAALHTERARPGEATMEVRYAGDHYQFQLRSERAIFPPVVMPAGRHADIAIDQALATMRELAGGAGHRDEATVRRLLRASGVRLWNEMVPELIRGQFWQIRPHTTALTIATDHDVIPWELLYPLAPGRDDGFLVERIPVVRLTYGQFRSPRIAIRNPHFIVGSDGPHNVAAEIAAIREIVGGGEPITRMSEFLEILESGGIGATHFACHNTFDRDGSHIEMDDGILEPWMLSSAQAARSLAPSQPAIFINACRSAGAAPGYTDMTGWAQHFMSAGAGAFIGTLWAVRSTGSADFATAFYRSLADGLPLGEAARAARTARHGDLLDPTWLAYTVYGDPYAVAV